MDGEGVKRFTASVSPDLLRAFDSAVSEMGYDRSKAIGLAMRNFLSEYFWEGKKGEVGAGAISLIYDHERRLADEKLTEIQHHHRDQIISATHVHLDDRDCLLIIAVRGAIDSIMKLAQEMMGQGGVKQVRLATLAL
jgi:CopG family nickel-responsive transcriptional regulator